MKKTMVIILAIMLLTLSFTACGKKDADKKEKAKTEAVEKENSEGKSNDTSAPAENEPAAEGDAAAQPDEDYAEGTDISEFESLVDTFNNSEDEEAQAAARIELEKILEQAEKQAPQQ